MSAYRFICTEPDTFTVTVEGPPSSAMGADIFASAPMLRAAIIMTGRGDDPLCPMFTSRIA